MTRAMSQRVQDPRVMVEVDEKEGSRHQMVEPMGNRASLGPVMWL